MSTRLAPRLKLIAATGIAAASFTRAGAARAATVVDTGVAAGVVGRSADAPYGLKAGLGLQLHADAVLAPFLSVGPYWLHDEHGVSGAEPRAPSVDFDTVGVRARAFLPLPRYALRPFVQLGVGYAWTSYSVPLASDPDHPAARTGGLQAAGGHFVEIPLGLGLAWDVARVVALSADFAVRPATSFGGTAYGPIDGATSPTEPKLGWSFLLGAALRL